MRPILFAFDISNDSVVDYHVLDVDAWNRLDTLVEQRLKHCCIMFLSIGSVRTLHHASNDILCYCMLLLDAYVSLVNTEMSIVLHCY